MNKCARPLTQRELDILPLIRDGYTCLNVGAILGISEHTVRAYVQRIYKKLHVNSRLQLKRKRSLWWRR